MAHTFSPLVAAANLAPGGSRKERRLKVIAGESAHVQSIHDRPAVNEPPAPTPPSAAPASPSPPPPTIELVRDGDQVRKIHVQCGCGKVIELECEF